MSSTETLVSANSKQPTQLYRDTSTMIQNMRPATMQDDKGGYRQINKSLNICAFDEYLNAQTANLPHLANVEQLTPRVLRVLGQNPGKVVSRGIGGVLDANTCTQFTFQGTNTYIIGTGRRRIIIDTAGGESAWAELIACTLESMNISLSHVLLTHV